MVIAIVAAVGGGSSKSSSAGGDIPGLQTFTGLSRNHVEGTVNYPQTPPVGGDHNPVWQTCAFYSKPIVTESGVHSMEHGAVWITYLPDLSQDQISVLSNLAASQDYILVSPWPGLPAPVVASAWGAQVKLDSATDPRLNTFLKKYRHSPNAPEPLASCSNGTSATVG